MINNNSSSYRAAVAGAVYAFIFLTQLMCQTSVVAAMSSEEFKSHIQRGRIFRIERIIEIYLGEDVDDFAVVLPLPPDTTTQRVLRMTISPEPDRIEVRGAQRYAWYESPLKRLEYRSVRYFADIEVASPFQLSIGEDLKSAGASAEELEYTEDDLKTEKTAAAADEIVKSSFLKTVRSAIEFSKDRVKDTNKCKFLSPDKLLRAGEGSRIEKAFLSSHLLRLAGIPSRIAQGKNLSWQQVWASEYGWLDVDERGKGNLIVAGLPILELYHNKRSWAPVKLAPGPSFRLSGKWSGSFRSQNFYFSDAVGIK